MERRNIITAQSDEAIVIQSDLLKNTNFKANTAFEIFKSDSNDDIVLQIKKNN